MISKYSGKRAGRPGSRACVNASAARRVTLSVTGDPNAVGRASLLVLSRFLSRFYYSSSRRSRPGPATPRTSTSRLHYSRRRPSHTLAGTGSRCSRASAPTPTIPFSSRGPGRHGSHSFPSDRASRRRRRPPNSPPHPHQPPKKASSAPLARRAPYEYDTSAQRGSTRGTGRDVDVAAAGHFPARRAAQRYGLAHCRAAAAAAASTVQLLLPDARDADRRSPHRSRAALHRLSGAARDAARPSVPERGRAPRARKGDAGLGLAADALLLWVGAYHVRRCGDRGRRLRRAAPRLPVLPLPLQEQQEEPEAAPPPPATAAAAPPLALLRPPAAAAAASAQR